MKVIKLFLLMLFTTMLLSGPVTKNVVLAQSTDQANQAKKTEKDTNFDTQLYLIVGTDQAISETKIPTALEPIIKQLRNTLSFKNYRVSATLINRVKNEGRLSLKWIGGPLLGSAADSARTPSFNEFHVNNVSLVTAENGQQYVRMEGFSFGSRIPIQSGTSLASTGAAFPVINYESTGLNTDISMAEGEPVVVGTVNVGPAGDAIILVMSARRTGR